MGRAKKYILGLTINALIFHMYILFIAGVFVMKSKRRGVRIEGILDDMHIINIIDMIVSFIFIMNVMNTMIMRNLLKFNTRFNLGNLVTLYV